MFKRFIAYYKPHKVLFFFDMLASLFVALIGMLYPILTRQVFNKYVPDVPYGVHFCHDDRKSAEAECARINKYLTDKAVSEKAQKLTFNF